MASLFIAVSITDRNAFDHMAVDVHHHHQVSSMPTLLLQEVAVVAKGSTDPETDYGQLVTQPQQY